MKNKVNKTYRPGIESYVILLILSIIIFTPFLCLKIFELRSGKIFFKGNDFYKCCFLCFFSIFLLWLELCATKVEIKDNRIVYTEHLLKKTSFHLDSIKFIGYGVGTFVIVSKNEKKIEINLNSIDKNDLEQLIEDLKYRS